MRTFLFCFFLFFNTWLFGQSGHYFLQNYAPPGKLSDQVCFDIAQDSKGVFYFASKSGVIEFDGRYWDLVEARSPVYSIQIDQENIYWAGARGFGKIQTGKDGFHEFITKSDSSVSNVFQCFVSNKQVYFVADDAIYVYDPGSEKTVTIPSSNLTGNFVKIFDLYGAVYVSTSASGIFKVESTKLIKSKLDIRNNVVFISRIENTYVIGTSDNQLYSCNDRLQLVPIKLEDQDYLDASVMVDGTWINRQIVAVATLRGGVMFINPITGRTEQLINYTTGLPDNEIYAIGTDRQQNVWVAHEYGYTQIARNLPFHSFNHYEGLKGNLLCAYSYKNSVYVGTSLGLFRLQREEIYDELVYYVDVPVAPVKKQVQRTQTPVQNPTPEVQENKVNETPEGESKKRGLFSFLRRKQKKKTESEPTAAKEESSAKPVEAPPLVVETTPSFRREKRVTRVLRNANYVYKKVQGIDAKVTHLMTCNGKLIASGLGGIHEILDNAAKPMLEQPVRYICKSPFTNTLYASTYENEVHVISAAGASWKKSNVLNNINDQVNFILEAKPSELWLCGLDKIYRLEIQDEVKLIQTLEFKNPDIETTIGVSWDDEVLFANSEGFFSFDRQTNKTVSIDSLARPGQYFAYEGNILYRDGHGWKLAGRRKSNELEILNLFKDLRFIASDENTNNLWIVSGTNELYKFYGDKISPYESLFPVYLKSIINDDRKYASLGKVNISEDKSSVSFSFVQPDYLNPTAIEFRYKLDGMNGEWSEWSSANSTIEFPYLPPGDYTLKVESRNIFGKVVALDPMSFEVLPPYWKRSWFYAMEFAIIASLVLLSFRLNTRYRFISQLLTMLTIILLIQFIQAFISNTINMGNNPVIDFIVQVFLALLILPVEEFLRKLMLRSLDNSSRFYQFLIPGTPRTKEEKLDDLKPVDED